MSLDEQWRGGGGGSSKEPPFYFRKPENQPWILTDKTVPNEALSNKTDTHKSMG